MRSLSAQTLIRFCDDMIDHGFHVPDAFPGSKLSICAGVCLVKDGTLVRREDRVA